MSSMWNSFKGLSTKQNEINNIFKEVGRFDQKAKERQALALERYIVKEQAENETKHKILLACYYSSLSQNDVFNKTFEKFIPKSNNKIIYDKLKKWTPESQMGLMLYGPVGTGKTHLLKALALKCASTHYQVSFKPISALCDTMRADFKQVETVIDSCLLPDLLILDDFGILDPSEWMKDKILTIIEKRLNRNKTIMISANLKLGEFGEKFGERLLDRLKEMLAFVEIKGMSHRNELAKSNQEIWESL